MLPSILGGSNAAALEGWLLEYTAHPTTKATKQRNSAQVRFIPIPFVGGVAIRAVDIKNISGDTGKVCHFRLITIVPVEMKSRDLAEI